MSRYCSSLPRSRSIKQSRQVGRSVGWLVGSQTDNRPHSRTARSYPRSKIDKGRPDAASATPLSMPCSLTLRCTCTLLRVRARTFQPHVASLRTSLCTHMAHTSTANRTCVYSHRARDPPPQTISTPSVALARIKHPTSLRIDAVQGARRRRVAQA